MSHPAGYTHFRLKVLLPPVVLLLFLLAALVLTGSHWTQDVTRSAAQTRAEATAHALLLSPDLMAALSGDGGRAERLLARTLALDPRLAYLILVTPQLRVLGVREDAEGAALRTALSLPPGAPDFHNSLHGPAGRLLGGVEVVVIRQRLLPPGQGGPQGDLFVAASLLREGAEHRAGLWNLMVLAGVGVLTYLFMVLYLLGGFTRRMEQLSVGVRRVEGGDLQVRVGSAVPDELGEVGRAFDAATERMSRMANQLRTVSQALSRTAQDIVEAAGAVRRGAAAQAADAEEATKEARAVVQGLGAVAQKADETREETRLGAAIIGRLVTVSQDAAAGVEEAERAAASTAEGIGIMAGSAAEMQRTAGALSETAASTASSMLEVKQGIGRVRETAQSAAALAEHAGIDAERGGLTLQDSMNGIEHIREASQTIVAVTDDLQRRVSEIGDILHLITELTQRTNLLALNASIIAAQAGAEGRGFAVVADEIKDLARRTASSAGSIDSLIQALAEGAHAARRAALAGGEAVEAGAAQARDAARTMGDILARLRSWSAMAKSIAAYSDDQARSAAQVMRSLQELQSHIGEIGTKATDQARRGEYLTRQAGRLQEIVSTLATCEKEQREGTAQVADTLARLVRTVEDLAIAGRSRATEGERVRNLLELVRRVAGGHREAVTAFDRAVVDLRALSAALQGELLRLKT